MAKKKGTVKVISLESTGPVKHRYQTRKNTRNTTERLELKKYNPRTRQHEMYKEIKK